MNEETIGAQGASLEYPLQIPTPGRDAVWSHLRHMWKAMGINTMPYRQRQQEFFKINPLPGVRCEDLSTDFLTFLPEEDNEHFNLFSLPTKINSLVGKHKRRPALQFFHFKDVEIIMGNRTFSIMSGGDCFDPVSGRIPSVEEMAEQADGYIPSAVLTMDRYGTANISHHLFDVVGRYIALSMSEPASAIFAGGALPMLLPAANRPYQNYVTSKMGVRCEFLNSRQKVAVGDLFVCAQVTVDEQEGFTHPAHMAHPATVQEMRRRLNADCKRQRGGKIYVSRRDTDRRKILNEEEVEHVLAIHGFKIIVPSAMTPEDQICCFSEAEVVVAPHGAGLTNLIGCESGTIVHELVHPLKGTDAYAGLSSALDLSYSFTVLADQGGDHTSVLNIEKMLQNLEGAKGL